MKNQNLSAISPKEIENAVKALKRLRQAMPFLIALSPLERSHSSNVGPKSLNAAQVSLLAAREYPAILPAGFDLAHFERTVQVFGGLSQCQTALKELSTDVQDTLLAVGTDALKGTQQIRALVKAAVKTTPGLSEIAQRLTTRTQRGVGAEVAPTIVPTTAGPADPTPIAPAPQAPAPQAAPTPGSKAA